MLNMNCNVKIETFEVHYLFQSHEKICIDLHSLTLKGPLVWMGILLTTFLKDGESTVESGSISSTTYSATSLLTSQGSSITEREAELILSMLSFGY